MTERSAPPDDGATPIKLRLESRIKVRRRNEWIFRGLGVGAVSLAVGALLLLVVSIAGQSSSAFVQNRIAIDVDLTDVAPETEPRAVNVNRAVQVFLQNQFPHVTDTSDLRKLFGLVSRGAAREIRDRITREPALIGASFSVSAPLDDEADLYRKGRLTERRTIRSQGAVIPAGVEGTVELNAEANDFKEIVALVKDDLRIRAARERRRIQLAKASRATTAQQLDRAETAAARAPDDAAEVAQRDNLRNRLESLDQEIVRRTRLAETFDAEARRPVESIRLTNELPSFLAYVNGGVVKLETVTGIQARGPALMPLDNVSRAAAGDWRIVVLETPQDGRSLSDQESVWIDHLGDQNIVRATFNSTLFTNSASNEPELAGLAGAIAGSFWTMLVTLILSFPIGVATAVYLEEFAPRNRLTDLIEVNINNLAAVPSIVFGLLGLAVFLNVFGAWAPALFARSSPLVGGLVLALMTLPTIIIASRAALKAVPPSIRQAAYGLGASPMQTTFQHVLPLAMPGVLTGTIIGMAQALGETAPLLMIGMSAFIVDVPTGVTSPAVVLPAQIFDWATRSERAFEERTAAAILILLIFLIAMNALAVLLRRRFERRW